MATVNIQEELVKLRKRLESTRASHTHMVDVALPEARERLAKWEAQVPYIEKMKARTFDNGPGSRRNRVRHERKLRQREARLSEARRLMSEAHDRSSNMSKVLSEMKDEIADLESKL